MTQAKAICIFETGGLKVMQYVDVDVPAPGPGEATIKQHAIGLNYIDIYFRTGLYPQPLPGGIGMKATGVVEAVGQGVTHVKPGDRMACAGRPTGTYAALRTIPADILMRPPDAIDSGTGTAMMLQGMTTQYLIRDSYRVQPGDTVLFRAVAGGVGLITCQWLKALGATVIGTVGSDTKAELAYAYGCDHTVIYTRENFTERVHEITGGKGVPVVCNGIGKDTFMGSLDCLAPREMMVTYGNAFGPVPPADLSVLSTKGSLKITRPTLTTYTARCELLESVMAELFGVVSNGKVKIEIHQRYDLQNAAQAHHDLETRKMTGSTILLP